MTKLNCLPSQKSIENQTRAIKRPRLPLTQRLSFSVGHILNDILANAWYSYLLIFLTKVEGLPNAQAGYVLFVPQALDAVCVPALAVLCDRTVCRYGRRKIWHLVGTMCVSVAFPFMFSRCIGCTDSPFTVKVIYYIGLGVIVALGWGITQTAHLSLLNEITETSTERIDLISTR